MGAVTAVDCGGTKLAAARSPSPAVIDDPVVRATPEALAGIPGAVVAAAGEIAGGGRAIGIGVAGLVDHHAGVLVWMPHVTGSQVPIAAEVRSATGLPVAVDNDANLAALAEARHGSGRGRRVVLALVLGTGIGGGLVVDGRLERGGGFLGEVGHVTAHPDGRECPCGRRGCWETVASGRALDTAAESLAAAEPGGPLAAAVAAGGSAGRVLVSAATDGFGPAVDALRAVGVELGAGIVDLVLTLDPDVVVIGGGPVQAGELLLGPAREVVDRELPGRPHRQAPPIVPAAFRDTAGLLGAAIIAREEAT